MTSKYKDLQQFANGCINSYYENSILRDICTVEEYSEDIHKRKEFIGIGKRINLPKRSFSDPSTVTAGLESDIGRAIFRGERNFILQRIRNKATHGQIEDYSIENFNYESLSMILEGNEFTDIFLPLRRDADETTLESLYKSGNLSFPNGKMNINMGGKDVRVHLLPGDTNLGSNRAFALNENRIQVIQKKKQIDDNPKGMELLDEYREIGVGEYLMLYFGEYPNSPDEIDILYRVLLSEPEISQEGAAAIHIPVIE